MAHCVKQEPPLHQRQVAGRLRPVDAGFEMNMMLYKKHSTIEFNSPIKALTCAARA
jgi:hypothetical protein